MRFETEYGYESLANNIVIQAAKDYRKSLKNLKKDPESFEAISMRDDCERFFRSMWYMAICRMDPERLISMLRKEAGYDGEQ